MVPKLGGMRRIQGGHEVICSIRIMESFQEKVSALTHVQSIILSVSHMKSLFLSFTPILRYKQYKKKYIISYKNKKREGGGMQVCLEAKREHHVRYFGNPWSNPLGNNAYKDVPFYFVF